ncbi:CxC2 domain-containing protein [Favolaschia claudopus]|uniref:CxC2 domain-containing protein n=1 Tax=Favolaschia claudopus TaxID=2862362 RepID=A0AAW0AYM3_9AGAR
MTGHRRGRGGAPPTLYTHRPDRAAVVRVSNDRRRVLERAAPVDRTATLPEYYQEDVNTNSALDSADFTYDMGDDSLVPEEEGPETDGISVRVRAKRYTNSDLPFQTWVGLRDEYLDEMLRLEGRGDAEIYAACASCGEADPRYRCENQTCYGPGMFCKSCVVEQHQVLPTHWIQYWADGCFERVSLGELGLVVQLGHLPGSMCGAMRRGKYKFTVIDVTGIHKVAVQFCECDSRIKPRQQLMRVCWWPATALDPSTCATFGVIRLFQNLNCLGKVSSFHFLCSLELLTNADGLNPLPNRRRAFIHIVRQHRMMEMMKRAGRGHSALGHGKNLPEGWNNINWAEMPEDLRYKYFTFLAEDANFRLINRNVSTEERDPVVDDGLGYFVNRRLYKEYLRNHVDEEEISTCSGFQAMFLADAKRGKGLRTTGVGGVTCARHNMWRPNGIGDLQRGERYCNMDFIFFAAILNTVMLYIILSYDIACQFSKKFWTRMTGLPEAMHINRQTTSIWFKVPNFHILGHKWPCHSPYSFHWMWGAGMTNGEDVEQNWEFTNGAAGSTKMMGPGGRHAFLEGLFAFHNWMRTVSYRKVLSQRLARALKEAPRHKEAFDAFTAVVEGERPELVAKWRGWVKEWESEQHTEGHSSPFELTKPVKSLKDIRLQLSRAELTRTGEGLEVRRQHTSSTLIAFGLDIENTQQYAAKDNVLIYRRILTIDVKATKDPTTTQEIDFVTRRTALLKRVNRFRNMQRVYMPELVRFLTNSQREIYEDRTRAAESIKLFMPSELAADVRDKAGETGLAKIEEEMREAELSDSLEELRGELRIRSGTNQFRHRNVTGQRGLTRGQGVLRQVEVRIHKAKLRYRYARNALLRLRGHGPWERVFRALAEEDVRGINERARTEEEKAEQERLRALGQIVEGGVGAAGIVAAGEGSHTMSWIWYKTQIGDGDEEMIDALRVEWCKTFARTRRWHEEIVLIDEEMRRTVQYGVWMEEEWERRAGARSRCSSELAEGLRAYAEEHIRRERRTRQRLTKEWSVLRSKATAYLAGSREMGESVVVDVDDVDGDDEEGDVPGEEQVEGNERDDEEDEADADDV